MTLSPPTVEHRSKFPLPAPPERVYRALVEPAELSRWFATSVGAPTLAPGGAFPFHGRASLGTPEARDATQTITAIEPGRSLSFRWAIHGVDTRVAWTLAPEGEATVLHVAHDVHGALPFRNAAHAIDDLWRLCAGNLSAHLSGGSNVVLPDFSPGARPEVRLSIEIAAPPAKVFRALLEPELMNRWLGGAARVDVAQRSISYGWQYEVEGRPVAGGPTRILELVQDRRLVTDWGDWRGDPAQPATRVTWDLEPLAGGTRTRLTLVHDGFGHPVDRSDYQQGWEGFADELRKVAEA